ncbi:MAG: hypothetical protein KJO29_13550, partial [Bacteroidia bacterium]|nr:hypothetical protein [Bacteroidia bacterium]
MKKLITPILVLFLIAGFGFSSSLSACHLSHLILDGVTPLGGNSYQIDLTFCAEGGEGQYVITQDTRT